MPDLRVVIEQGDVLGKAGDVLALKYARAFHGVDRTVATKLRLSRGPDIGQHEFHDAIGGVQTREVMLLGTPGLASFRYAEIRAFAMQVLSILAEERPSARELVMTLHGPGYGLDETEAFLSQLAGYRDAIAASQVPPSLERITIAELDADRVKRLKPVLREVMDSERSRSPATKSGGGPAVLEGVGAHSDAKPHAFVAMPYSIPMKNVYYFGIRKPVKSVGWPCERVDQSVFTGDVLDRVKDRIKTSCVVIADLTGANPNVFLELGFAWGSGRPTILVTRNASELPFDVRGQRCLEYGEDIRKLARLLRREILGLREALLI
jgi:hypothetical protein